MPVNPPPINVKIGGTDRLSRVLNKVQAKLGKFGRSALSVGKNLTMRMSLPMALVGAAAVRAAGNFEASMLNVQALTKATGGDFDKMKDQAKDLGATTMFSASQAGEAMGFLAMAGFESNEILDATPGILNLAAAGNLELAEAADIASNVLTGFGLEASEINRVNAAMAHTAASANTNVQQLGEAMKFVAPVAAGLGVSVEETSAAIGLLGNAGIQASMAGTSLRKIMFSLVNPTAEAVDTLNQLGVKRADIMDSAGNIKSLTHVVKALEKSGAGAEEAFKIFGQRAGPSMVALLSQGSGALEKLNKEIGTEGAASLARLAAARMAGFNGQMKALKSALEAVAIAIADAGVLKWLTDFAGKLAEGFRSMAKFHPWVLKIVAVIGILMIVIPPLIAIMGGLAIAVNAVTWPIALVVLGIAALIAIGVLLVMKWGAIKKFFVGLWNTIMEHINGPLGLIMLAFVPFIALPLLIIKNWERLKGFFKGIGSGILKAAGAVKGFFTGDDNEVKVTNAGAAATGDRVADVRRENVTRGEATVNLNMANLPPGTRVETENKDVDLNQNLGYAAAQ